MAGELVVMSTRELDRLGVIKQVLERRLTRVKAAEVLGLTPRQVTRLCDSYARDGAAGLASRKRGRSSNRKLGKEVESQVVELVRAHYLDFGPTLTLRGCPPNRGQDGKYRPFPSSLRPCA